MLLIGICFEDPPIVKLKSSGSIRTRTRVLKAARLTKRNRPSPVRRSAHKWLACVMLSWSLPDAFFGADRREQISKFFLGGSIRPIHNKFRNREKTNGYWQHVSQDGPSIGEIGIDSQPDGYDDAEHKP